MKTISLICFATSLCAQETLITSDHVEMVTEPTQNVFHFTGNVKVSGTDLRAEGDSMTVYSAHKEGQSSAGIGSIDKIFAKGSVLIVQTEREARAGSAEIYPTEGRLVLMDSPEVKEKDGIVRGEKIVFVKGEHRAIVEGAGPTQRATVLLPNMAHVDIDADKKD
ncbi:MAG: hypothetical protein A2Y14_04460 [Verrucomicrobia bacterium GWF2_51_19]|nr:MAG: hypothetical protein A2Y14_04460 [Verrucomicrobia bacterium GWF2_51_19]